MLPCRSPGGRRQLPASASLNGLPADACTHALRALWRPAAARLDCLALARGRMWSSRRADGQPDYMTGGEILELLHESVENFGQTMVMVTHEARAAAAADRILFLADGRIIKDLGRAGEEEILDTIREVTLA